MRNLANKNRVKRNIYFNLCVSMFLGSIVFVFSTSAAMLTSDPDATTQEKALLFYDQDAAMRARDKVIKNTLIFCIPNLGHAPVICPLVQDYDDSMYAFNYGRPLTRLLSLFIPSFGPRQLIKGYNGLTAEEQKERQEELDHSANILLYVENSLKNGARVSRSCSDLMRLTLMPPRAEEFECTRLPIARLLLTEGAKLPSVRKVLISGDYLQAIEFILKYSEKLDEKDLGEALIDAVQKSISPIVKLLLVAGADIYTAKAKYKDYVRDLALVRFVTATQSRGVEKTEKAIAVLKEIAHAGGFDSVNLDPAFINDHDNGPQIDTLVREGQRERESHIGRCISEVYLSCIAPIIKGYAASCPVEADRLAEFGAEELLPAERCSESGQLFLK